MLEMCRSTAGQVAGDPALTQALTSATYLVLGAIAGSFAMAAVVWAIATAVPRENRRVAAVSIGLFLLLVLLTASKF
jgi:hypothetical protein